MSNKPHRDEHARRKAIKSAMRQPQPIEFEEHEEVMVKSELLPFILTHFFPKEKQKQIRRFLHTLRSDEKKKRSKQGKRTDSLDTVGDFHEEHPLHNSHQKIMRNRDDSARAKAKRRR